MIEKMFFNPNASLAQQVFALMKNKLLLLTTLLLSGQAIHAQVLATKTGLRFYEHHSKDIAGSTGANGSQSGYDFVTRNYVHSFNASNMGAYTDGTDTTIDMVEHNGVYGNGRKFGFTSGVSSIWGGDIKGNGTTKWMQAPASFNYTTATDVNDLKAVYNAATATQAIDSVVDNTVYIGRIRNSELYVAIRCYNVTNKVAGNTYFDFDYKYGVWTTTSISNVQNVSALSVYPNPSAEKVTFSNIVNTKLAVKITSVTGQQVSSLSLGVDEVKTMDLTNMSNGLYLITCTAEDGSTYLHKLIKQ